jgi:hypothetical protein
MLEADDHSNEMKETALERAGNLQLENELCG